MPQLPPVGIRGQEVHLVSSERTDTRLYDISRWEDRVSCGTQRMELNDEEAVFFYDSCCVEVVKREPYAHMGSVEVSQEFKCCVSVSTDQATIRPGCGCNRPLTEEISHELQRLEIEVGICERPMDIDEHG